jgi:hypothetical protein
MFAEETIRVVRRAGTEETVRCCESFDFAFPAAAVDLCDRRVLFTPQPPSAFYIP